MKRNKFGQTPQEVARENILQQLRFMATEGKHRDELFKDTERVNGPLSLQAVRQHYAKINNSLAYKWGMDENTIDMKEIE